MSGEIGTYQMACSMKLTQASNIRNMIKYSTEFSRIEIDINADRKTYNPAQSEKVPIGEVLVTFCIPCEGINMIDFFGEINKTLNRDSTAVHGERVR